MIRVMFHARQTAQRSLVLCVKRLNCFSLILRQCVRSEHPCFLCGVKLSNCV